MAILLTDESGNLNTLTNNGATEVTSSLPFPTSSKAVQLTAASYQYLEADDSTSLSITGDFTAEYWVNFSTLAYCYLVSKYSTAGGLSWHHRLYMDGATPYLFVQTTGDNVWNNRDDVGIQYDFSPGTWYHIAISCDISNSLATRFTFYVNGINQGNGTIAKDSGTTQIYDSTSKLSLGRNENGSDYLDGQLDEVRIWNDVRTPTEISDNKSVKLTGTEAGLVAYWPFEAFNQTKGQSAKASIYTGTAYSKNNSAKAFIPTQKQTNSVIANVATHYVHKTFEYRIYNQAGSSYVSTWSKEVVSEPSFRTVINGGAGEMVVKLARKFDDFGEGEDVSLFNTVECWCFDREQPNGVLIYTGYISGYRPVFAEHTEYVEITLLPFYSEMANYMMETTSGTTTVAMNSYDPSDMFRGVIDYYNYYGGKVRYTADSVDDTSTVVSYVFQAYTTKEALDKVIELTPEYWYWRIDPDNIAYLKASDMNIADHTFLIGKHISSMETWRRGEDIVNQVYFFGQEDSVTGKPMYRKYVNSGSVSTYGVHAAKKVDQRVSLTTTADIMSNRILDLQMNPEIRTTITILDSNGTNSYRGYDIESIKPGQTMRIRNIKQGVKTVSLWDQMMWDVDVWDQTLSYSAADIIQIMSVEYHPNYVVLEASSRLPDISKRVEDIYRNAEDNAVWNAPGAPTAG